MPSARPTFLALSAAAVLGGGVATGAGVVLGDQFASSTPTTTTITQPSAVAKGEPVSDEGLPSANEIYRSSIDSVAYIEAEVVQQSQSPFGPPREARGTASGSGFVVSSDGLVVTNEHVVDGARSIQVTLGDEDTPRSATVVSADASRDLALLRVERKQGERLPALDLASTSDVQVGDTTYAIGSPYGLEQTLTTGVISAKARKIEAPDGTAISNVLQTDAAINPGNSGGPLLDAQGRVIGVNSQIASSSGGSVGIGFAVPSETVREFVAQSGAALTTS